MYSRLNWNLEVLVFMEGGKPENPEKNPQSKDENQQQTQPTCDTGPESNPGHIGGRRALSPLRHPCSPSKLESKGKESSDFYRTFCLFQSVVKGIFRHLQSALFHPRNAKWLVFFSQIVISIEAVNHDFPKLLLTK